MANPTAPVEGGGKSMGFGLTDVSGTATVAVPKMMQPVTIEAGTTLAAATAVANPDTLKSAVISAATSGNNTLVAAVTDKRIAVWSYFFIVEGAVSVRFESAAGGTALTGVMAFTAAGQQANPHSGGLVPLFITAASALLNMELSSAVQVSGHLSYTEID